jgi:hypothetical protein
MLGKLKIRCIYEKNGCKKISFLFNLKNHEKICRFNQCFCLRSVDHDCIQELKLARDEISSSITVKENYLLTTQELSIEKKSKNFFYFQTYLRLIYNIFRITAYNDLYSYFN